MTTPVLSLWIAGKDVAASSGRLGDVFDPSTGQVVRRVPLAGREDVARAVAAAEAALPAWRDTAPLRRARILMRYRELLDAQPRRAGAPHRRGAGKTTADAAGSLQRGIEVVEFAMGVPHLLKGEQAEEVAKGVSCHSVRQPVGRLRGDQPVQLPGHGADVDVPARHRLWEHLRPEALGAGALHLARAGAALRGGGTAAGSPQRRPGRRGGGRCAPRPSRRGRGVVRRLYRGGAARLRDGRPQWQARPGAGRSQEPCGGDAGRRPRWRRRRAGGRRLRLGRRALHGNLRGGGRG